MSKKGFIRITDQLYKENWLDIAPIFKDFKPFHIEFRPQENDIWYFYGYSEKFEQVNEGERIPEYEVIITKGESWYIPATYTVKKINP